MEGFIGWRIKDKKVKEVKYPKFKPRMVELTLPGACLNNPYVDSVCSLGDGLLATKCVGMGKILVFRADFGGLIKDIFKLAILATFVWHMTDNFYMNIGGSVDLGLMACGDDQGRTWIYKLPTNLTGEIPGPPDHEQTVLPVGHLPWPDLGKHAVVSGQTMLDKVAFSPCGQYLVAVTDTNIIAIWRRGMRGASA